MIISVLRTPIRVILGDRQVHGIWNYDDSTVDSAVKTLFMLGRGPDGFAMDSAQKNILPDPPNGDPMALICYDAALLLIGGEDGSISYRTKAVSVHDAGDRKRDLSAELRVLIYKIRDGGSVFSTVQSFNAFIHSGIEEEGIYQDFTDVDVSTGVQQLDL